MNTKEKAKELVDKFDLFNKDWSLDYAKTSALICVEEMLNNLPFRDYGLKFDSIDSRFKAVYGYWKEVKQEIEKL